MGSKKKARLLQAAATKPRIIELDSVPCCFYKTRLMNLVLILIFLLTADNQARSREFHPEDFLQKYCQRKKKKNSAKNYFIIVMVNVFSGINVGCDVHKWYHEKTWLTIDLIGHLKSNQHNGIFILQQGWDYWKL